MSVLRMDSDGLHQLAGNIENKAEGFDTLISTFDTNTKNITEPEVWDGDDAVAFASAAEEFKSNLDKASQFLHSVASDLERTASDYDTTHEGSVSRSQSL